MKPGPRILVTGFEAFGGMTVNPTERLIASVRAEPGTFTPLGCELRTAVLPVTFADAFEILREEIVASDPDVIVSLGLAAGRSDSIEIERLAINCLDAEISDNAGKRPKDAPIVSGGDVAIFSTLPLQAILRALRRSAVPAKISNSAGTYVCNYVFYRLLEMNRRTRRRSGFVHVPLLPEQSEGGKKPFMTFELMQKGLQILLGELVTDRTADGERE